MEGELAKFGLTAFATLLIVVEPFGLIPIFTTLMAGADGRRKRVVLTRAVTIALGVALFFLVTGRSVLSYLGVTVHAFAISGGLLLFATALPMLFGQRAGLQSLEPQEQGAMAEDISVFPLAIPLLSGPGTLTTILLLTDRARGDVRLIAILAVAISIVFLVTWVVVQSGVYLMAWVGEGGLHVMTRVMGIVLAALAVQFVLNGAAGYFGSLAGR
jgi:multiple antibiotic resistance protein